MERSKSAKKPRPNTRYIYKSATNQINFEEIINKPEYDFQDKEAMNIVNEEVQRIKTLTELFVSSPRKINNTRPPSAHINIRELTDLKAELKSRARQF